MIKDQLSHPAITSRGPVIINIKDPQQCFYCNSSPLNSSVSYCPACGFPQFGDEKEQKRFIMDKRMLRMEFEEAEEKVGKARIAIFGVAALLLINYVMLYYQIKDNYAFIEGGIVVSFFIGLGIVAGKHGYVCALIAIIVYSLLIIAYAISEPMTIISGLIWKIAIYSALIYGLKAANDAKKLKQKLSSVSFDLNSGTPKQ